MYNVISVCREKEIIEQIFQFAKKQKNKNIYISHNLMVKLSLVCDRKETIEKGKIRLIFLNGSKENELILSDVFNKVWQSNVFMVDYIKEYVSPYFTFEKEHKSSFESDEALLCEIDEELNIVGFEKIGMCQCICAGSGCFVNLITGAKNDFTGIR